MSGALLENALLFGRVLRGLGLDAGPDRMIDFVHALEHVPVGARSDVYHCARALFVRRRDEISRFDEAWEIFWRKPAGDETTLDLRSMGERRRFRRPAFAATPPAAPAAAPSDPREPP